MTGKWIRKVDAADVLAGVAAGAVGGLIGAWAMNRFHAAVGSLSSARQDEVQRAGEEEPGDAQAAERGKEQGGEPTTVLAAKTISERVLRHELTPREKRIAGPAMHYGFGAAMGAVYGGVAEMLPTIRLCEGTAYGTAVWLAADEAAVPALGLSRSPTQYPASTHLSAWGAHIAFGLVIEWVRRMIRSHLS